MPIVPTRQSQQWAGTNKFPFVRGATIVVAASDASDRMKSQADYVCLGAADDVDVQAALDALPSSGGSILLSEGTLTFSQQVARAIDDVMVIGQGKGTQINLNGSTAVISAGSQDGWCIFNIATDAGDIDISSATNAKTRTWRDGSLVEYIDYGATAPSGIIVRGSGVDFVRIGRAAGARPGISIGGTAHFSMFMGPIDDNIERWHFDMTHGYASGFGLGLDWIASQQYGRVKFDPNPETSGGAIPATLLGLPERTSDPADIDGDNGTATSGTAMTLVDTGQAWDVDQWIGYMVIIVGGTGKGQARAIYDNDATTLHVRTAIPPVGLVWDTAPDDTSDYVIGKVFAGDIWYDTTDNVIRAFDGTSIANLLTGGLIADPGDGNAIPVTRSGYVPLVTGGAETRTLADAAAPGLTLDLYLKTDGGDCVITAASDIDQAGNNVMTFDTVGEHIRLTSIEDGADYEWRVVANDGVALA